ncbi:hypothetical protein MCOR13_007823 [Pyricularia oryzae]|nr:hypothetical protein MCOR13_007823 [Pyricularia oryzae]
MSIAISQLSLEHHRDALGIGEASPRISWRFDGNVSDWEQSAFDVEVARSVQGNRQSSVYSFNSSQSLFVNWPAEPLSSAEQALIRTRAHGGEGQPSTPWSDWVAVETGLLSRQDWRGALPIVAERPLDTGRVKQPVYFRKDFSVDDKIKSARLYITGLGIYEAEINGKRVGDHVLAPGWQSYGFRHVYDTYDVTDMIQDGDNAIGAVVGEGWFSGPLGGMGADFSWVITNNNWGDSIGLYALLVVTKEDNSTVVVPTDGTWTANTGPILSSGIYAGEAYDSRLEEAIQGWSSPSFNQSTWLATKQVDAISDQLASPDGPPMRKLEERKPQSVFRSPSGKTLVDFGQNLVGWLRVDDVEGPSGTKITFKHAEVLDKDELGTRPLRLANATDTLILHGKGPQSWEPRFTYHGFRYVQVDGWPEGAPPLAESLTAVVIHSDMERTGWFECSHALLSKFHENVLWSMKGNFLSLPTDCPQRDERLGWSGDAHAFGPTANYLYNTAGFFRGWHRDIDSEMQVGGSMVVPAYIPNVPARQPPALPALAVWGDVSVGNPWNLYRFFGDGGMLEAQFAQASNWVGKGIYRNDVGLWDRRSFQFADWLDPKSPPENPGAATTAPLLVADAYLVRMTELLANMSTLLGKSAQTDEYRRQHTTLVGEFRKAWMTTGDGRRMANETQTAYALALEFGLYADEAERASAGATLRSIVADNDYLVGTGFAGTPALGPALRAIGATEDFYRMLLQTRTPSWLYQVAMNGTTTWERWDSMMADGTINPGEMTSFNHYAFGSVADWIHQTVGGLQPAEPGWKKVKVAPVPGGGITSADAIYVSGYGQVRCKWSIRGGQFMLEVWVPPNSRAEITLPRSGRSTEVGSGYHVLSEDGH